MTAKSLLRRTFFALLLSLVMTGPATAGELPPELLAAATRLSSHDTVRARFEQTKSSVLFMEDVVRTGTLALRRTDGRLLWTYDDGPSFLMADGRFYPAGKSAAEAGKDGASGFSMPGAGHMTSVLQAVFTLDPDALAAHFNARVTEPGTFELTPKDAAAKGLFKLVTLTVGGEPLAVTRTAMDEPTGDSTVIAFSEVDVGSALPPEHFMTPAERTASEGKK
ncbi:MAG: outer membrane lipoprotein carrier protein LolA [Deltaproteobacteria bacterium]|nr:outer membrane lipoprotein carrier protein LolA [Deltaproteobacteria bacterium]